MPVPFIDLNPQHQRIGRETLAAVSKVLSSQHFVLGEQGNLLETECGRYLGSKFAVGLASGSDALYLALVALGIGKGDEVITTPFSFFATASSIVRTGAKAVFADIDPVTFNLDPEKIPAKITRRTRAILPVHLFGLSCEMDAIMRIAKKRGLAVVEDAAQSFGASYKGKKTGSIGDIGCFSFYPTKNLGGAGDGGMISTNSAKLADKIRILRNHGSRQKYFHETIGLNSRLDELQAAVIRVKLGYINRWNAARQRHAKAYERAFRDLPLVLPPSPSGSRSISHLYTVRSKKRDALSAYLSRRGIGNGIYYPVPLHRQPCFKKIVSGAGLAESEKACREVLSLPMFAELTDAQIRAVIRTVREFFNK